MIFWEFKQRCYRVYNNTCVALPTLGTWRNDDYVSALRLVDDCSFYKMGGRVVYINIG